MSNAAAQVIHTPNVLKAKFGGRFSIDPEALAKAEAALKGLSSNFGQWMQDELDKLEEARAAILSQGLTQYTGDQLYSRAHDLKGLGATYEFPIVGRIAAILCRLIEEPQHRATAPLALIDAHISAIKAAVRDDIREETHPVGRILVAELERKVDLHLK